MSPSTYGESITSLSLRTSGIPIGCTLWLILPGDVLLHAGKLSELNLIDQLNGFDFLSPNIVSYSLPGEFSGIKH